MQADVLGLLAVPWPAVLLWAPSSVPGVHRSVEAQAEVGVEVLLEACLRPAVS